MVTLTVCIIHRDHSVDDYKVRHVDNKGADGEAKVPDVPPANALTEEDAVMVRLVDADVAQVAMDSIRVHVDVACVASVMPLLVSVRKHFNSRIGACLTPVDLGRDARVTEKAREEKEEARN